MNESAKKFLKELKTKRSFKFLSIFFLLLGLAIGGMGASMLSKNIGLEPVKYTASTPKGTYCYVDVQLMTETYASLTNYGISTKEYCLAADADYNWLSVGISGKRYEEFADIVEYTYSDEENAPATIRVSGTLMDMEAELKDFTDEYAVYLFEGDASIVRDGIYLKDGMNDDLLGGLVSAGIGALMLFSSIFLMIKGGESKRNAKASVEELQKNGQLEDAIAEFHSDSSLKLGNKKQLSSVLGENFIFLLTSGKIMRYSDINCLSLEAVADKNEKVASKRVLNVHDVNGTTYPVTTEVIAKVDASNSPVLACLNHIQQRNPNAKVI